MDVSQDPQQNPYHPDYLVKNKKNKILNYSPIPQKPKKSKKKFKKNFKSKKFKKFKNKKR